MTSSRFLHSQVRNYRCAQCWGSVVMVRSLQEGQEGWIVHCPRACRPGGLVSAAWVEFQRAHDRLRLEQVASNYPELAGRPTRPEDIKAAAEKAINDLYGGDR